MGTLSAMPDPPIDDATGPRLVLAADPARRDRFLGAARPELDRVYRLAGLILGESHEAEDAVQDALAAAWQRVDGLREPAKFGAWLGRVGVNGCRGRLCRPAPHPVVPPPAG